MIVIALSSPNNLVLFRPHPRSSNDTSILPRGQRHGTFARLTCDVSGTYFITLTDLRTGKCLTGLLFGAPSPAVIVTEALARVADRTSPGLAP